jgi:hypothetical protein
MTWTSVKGHEGPGEGLRASGPQGLDPLFTHLLSWFLLKLSNSSGLLAESV